MLHFTFYSERNIVDGKWRESIDVDLRDASKDAKRLTFIINRPFHWRSDAKLYRSRILSTDFQFVNEVMYHNFILCAYKCNNS